MVHVFSHKRTGKSKNFSRGTKSGKVSFYTHETKKTTLFAKHFNMKMSNLKIQGEQKTPLHPISDTHGLK